MNAITRTGWMFWLFIAALVQLSAESLSNLTCEVKLQHDGSVMYQLSKLPGSPGCVNEWEDKNRTHVAHGSTCDEKLVQNLTLQFIVLRVCQDYLHYTQDCFTDFQEAHCHVNCSRLLNTTSQTNTVNPTLTCVFGSWCPDQLTIGLSIAGILGLAACVFGRCYVWKHIKRRRARTAIVTTSYTRADEEVVVEVEKEVIISS